MNAYLEFYNEFIYIYIYTLPPLLTLISFGSVPMWHSLSFKAFHITAGEYKKYISTDAMDSLPRCPMIQQPSHIRYKVHEFALIHQDNTLLCPTILNICIIVNNFLYA